MARARRADLLRLAAAALLVAASPALALYGDVNGPLGVDGSLRSILTVSRPPGVLADLTDPWVVTSQTLLRLTALGQPRPWLAYEFHGVQSVDASSGPVGGAFQLPIGLTPGDLRYRPIDATLDWASSTHAAATLFADRFNVRLTLPGVDVTLGRQAITWGKTWFWNPADVFLAFDPRQFDQDYKPGVDAVRVQVPLGRFAGFEVVGAPGRTILDTGVFVDPGRDVAASWFGSAVVARVFGTLRGFDWSLQGGKIYGGTQVGGGLVGELGPLELRSEVVQLFAQPGPRVFPARLGENVPLVPDATSAVVGIGHRFPSSLTLEAEYFRNGAGDSDDLSVALVRFATGGALDLSENLVGASVSYELLPILLGQLIGIVSCDDGSVQVQPRLTWSAADEIEVLAGAIVSRGARPALGGPLGIAPRSEFGTFPDVYYVEAKWYF